MKGDAVDQMLSQETVHMYDPPLSVHVTHLFGDWYWMPAHEGWLYRLVGVDSATFVGVDEYGGEVMYSMEYRLKTRWGALLKQRGRLPLDSTKGV